MYNYIDNVNRNNYDILVIKMAIPILSICMTDVERFCRNRDTDSTYWSPDKVTVCLQTIF